MEFYDIIVVGAGPAGTIAARILADSGLNVLVIEKDTFPRTKPCAGWISPLVLELTGISPKEYSESGTIVPFSSVVVWDTKDVPREVVFEKTMGYGIIRSQFDAALVSNIGGATLRENTKISLVERDEDGIILNSSFKAPVVIGAGGHFCPVAKTFGNTIKKDKAVYAVVSESKIGRNVIKDLTPYINTPEIIFNDDFSGYGWYFSKGDYLNIGVGSTSPKDINFHKEKLLGRLREKGRLPDPKEFLLSKFSGYSYKLNGVVPRKGVSSGVVLVGDALGIAYNMSGEGIGPAIFSGVVAAETIIKAGGDYSAVRLSPYIKKIHSRFGKPYPALLLWILSSILKGLIMPLRMIVIGNGICRREIVAKKWFFRD